jgi:DivIVA domain-containing protein
VAPPPLEGGGGQAPAAPARPPRLAGGVERRPGQREQQRVVGALADLGLRRVAAQAGELVAGGVGAAGGQTGGAVDRPDRGVGRDDLRGGRQLARLFGSRVDGGCGAVDQRLDAVAARDHLPHPQLRVAVIAEDAVADPPLGRLAQGRLQAAVEDAERPAGDVHAADVERAEHHPRALAEPVVAAQHLGAGRLVAGEPVGRRLDAAVADLVEVADLPCRRPAPVGRGQDDAGRLLGSLDLGHQEHDVRRHAAGDPALLAVEHEPAALAPPRRRLQAPEVAAGLRLGDRERGQDLAACDAGQPPRLLLGGPVARQQRGRQAGRVHRSGQRDPALREDPPGGREVGDPEPEAAVLLAHQGAAQAGGHELVERGVGQRVRGVPPLDVRQHHVVDVGADGGVQVGGLHAPSLPLRAGNARPRWKRRHVRARSDESLSVYVRQSAFRRVMRGYDPVEVDRHLETISQMIAQGAIGEMARGQEEKLAEREAALEAAEARTREDREEAERLLREARVEADATVQGAGIKARALNAEAERTLAEARAEADRTLAEARAEAARLRDGARIEAEASELLTAARAEAEGIVTGARADAAQELNRLRAEGRSKVDQEVAEHRRALDAELDQYVARRRREADRLVEAARADRRR